MDEIIQRVSVKALDEILGKKFHVLDKGFIRVIDYLGADESIVQAARVSYGKGTKSVSEDEGLIRYLLRHTHTTPFEMCELKFHVRMPMDVMRQWIRQRTANVNEYSTRYSEAIDDKQKTDSGDWRLQSELNKQGSSGNVIEWTKEFKDTNPDLLQIIGDETPGEYLSEQERIFHLRAKMIYEERLQLGVAKEQARKDLPLSTYTEAYWKCDLHNILHFLSLRMDSHAQLEIRSFANVMGDIVSRWCPIAWAAWNDYNFRRGAVLLTARDKQILRSISHDDSNEQVLSLMNEYGWWEKDKHGIVKNNRERSECESKLASLGFTVPWLQEGWVV